jgi:hypothetical protein
MRCIENPRAKTERPLKQSKEKMEEGGNQLMETVGEFAGSNL